MTIIEYEKFKTRSAMYGLGIEDEQFVAFKKTWDDVHKTLKATNFCHTHYVYLTVAKLKIDKSNSFLLLVWEDNLFPRVAIVAEGEEDAFSTTKSTSQAFSKLGQFCVQARAGMSYQPTYRAYRVKTQTRSTEGIIKIDQALFNDCKYFLFFAKLFKDSTLKCFKFSHNFNDDNSAYAVTTSKEAVAMFKKHCQGIDSRELSEYNHETIQRLLQGWCKITYNKDLIKIFPNIHDGLMNKKNPESAYICKIMDVFELSNSDRLICSVKYVNRGYGSGFELVIETLSTDHRLWQFADVGRTFYTGSLSMSFSNSALVFTDDNPLIPQQESPLVDYIKSSADSREALFLTNAEVDRIIVRSMKRQTILNKQKVKTSSLATHKHNAIDAVITDKKKSITINNMKISATKVEYENQIIKLTGYNPARILKSTVSHYRNQQDINFDRFMEVFKSEIDFKMRYAREDTTGIVGEIPVKINYKGNLCYVNDYRINKNEVAEVITQALCFVNFPDYQKFVSKISKCSLKIHNYIHFGFVLDNVVDPYLDLKLSLKFKVVRQKNKHYIEINEILYPIHNINKLARIQTLYEIDNVIDLLSDDSIINIPRELIVSKVIKSAKSDYYTAVKKSKELLEKVCSLCKVHLETRQISGSERKGYVIQGKRSKYFLEHSSNATVYDISGTTQRTLCIVEKNGHGMRNAKVGVDVLVNKIMALKNDNLVAHAIHTL